jgi:hypothetical protein
VEANLPTKGVPELAPEHSAALKNLAAGKGEPLALARTLRPVAHLLETGPEEYDLETGRLPDNPLVYTVRGLVWLSSPEAFALVENNSVPVDQAAAVGHYAHRWFDHDHPPQVSRDFQFRAMTRLAHDKPLSLKLVIKAIDKTANEVIDPIMNERRRGDYEREPWWSKWVVLSWIAYRDVYRLGEIKDKECT